MDIDEYKNLQGEIKKELSSLSETLVKQVLEKCFKQARETHQYQSEFTLCGSQEDYHQEFIKDLESLCSEKKVKLANAQYTKKIQSFFITLKKTSKYQYMNIQVVLFVSKTSIDICVYPGNSRYTYYIGEYKQVLNIIRDLLSIEKSILKNIFEDTYNQFYTSPKNAEIARGTALTLCKTFLDSNHILYFFTTTALSLKVYVPSAHRTYHEYYNIFSHSPDKFLEWIKTTAKNAAEE